MYIGPRRTLKPDSVTVQEAVTVCPETGARCLLGKDCADAGICWRDYHDNAPASAQEIIAQNPGRDYARLFTIVLIIVAGIGLAVKYVLPRIAGALS